MLTWLARWFPGRAIVIYPSGFTICDTVALAIDAASERPDDDCYIARRIPDIDEAATVWERFRRLGFDPARLTVEQFTQALTGLPARSVKTRREALNRARRAARIIYVP